MAATILKQDPNTLKVKKKKRKKRKKLFIMTKHNM